MTVSRCSIDTLGCTSERHGVLLQAVASFANLVCNLYALLSISNQIYERRQIFPFCLIDQMIFAYSNATILVVTTIPTSQAAFESSAGPEDRTPVYNRLIPGVVAARAHARIYELTVDFGDLPLSALDSGGMHTHGVHSR